MKPVQYTDPNSGAVYGFDHTFAVNSKTYIKYKKMPTLICYMWQKSEIKQDHSDLQWETDTTLYNEECLAIYNSVIGDGFSSPGGLKATKVGSSQTIPTYLCVCVWLVLSCVLI